MNTYQQQILQSFVLPTAQPHTPAFRVEREGRRRRIFDGDREIAACWGGFFDIWSFGPNEPFEMANTERAGKVVDLHTVHNTVLNLGFSGWPERWRCDRENLEWTWPTDQADALEGRLVLEYQDGERLQWLFRLRYDEAWGRYRFTFDVDAWKIDPPGLEPFNMMLAGALEARPERRRWTHSIWEDCDGNLRRIVHSNALFGVTDYGMGPLGARWRTRNIPYRGAWVGYAAHKSFNPCMLIHRTSVPMKIATCSQLFDEHLIWGEAGQDNITENGLFHFHMSLEFVNLKPDMAAQFLDAGIDPTKPKQWRHEGVALPFRIGEVNAFEEAVDPWEPEECPIIELPQGGTAVAWAEDAARSGRRSIRLSQERRIGRLQICTSGAVCRVQPHRRYRLSGWIKTRDVERFARLELDSYEYTNANVIDHAASVSVEGTGDWRRVEVELDAGEEAYLMPRLVLYGQGTAWFDDLKLEEVG